MVVRVGPGEQKVDAGWWHLGWEQYLSSGHQVAHARVQLWGGDPSTRASVHTLATHQNNVIRSESLGNCGLKLDSFDCAVVIV